MKLWRSFHNFVAIFFCLWYSNGAIGKITFKSQEELDDEYNINIEKINQKLKENNISTTEAEEIKTKLFFTYANFIKHAPSNPEYIPKQKNINQKFTIIKKEQAVTEAQKKKTISALIAGVCILGTIVSVCINNEEISYALEKEIKNINSFNDFKQFIKDIGVLTTIFATSALTFIAKYFKDLSSYRK